MSLIGCILLAAVASTSPRIEHLGQPCRGMQILAGRVVMNRSDGRERLVVTSSNEAGVGDLIFIDFERNTAKAFPFPVGGGSWLLNEVPGDRLIVGEGEFTVFDLRKMEFVKSVKFTGEGLIWNLATGSDGRIYGGTYPGGKLGAFDLTNYTLEDCGNPVPPNTYLRWVSAMPDGRILCSFGMIKPATMLYDPAAKKFEAVPKQLEGITMGVSWNGDFLAGSHVYRGKSLEVIDAPFPTPKGGWSVNTQLTSEDVLFLQQGNAIYRFAKGDHQLAKICDIDLRGGVLHGATKSADLLGTRGSDYFIIKPGDTNVQLRPIPVESPPRPMVFLNIDSRGRLWGGPYQGQTIFSMDPITKHVVNTSKMCNSSGEVCGPLAFHNGKVYAATYSSGEVVEYDPDQPWDQWGNKNPRLLTTMITRGYVRPSAGIHIGPDGKLYSGWMARYGVYGGAVAITDPATGATELIENPLGELSVYGMRLDEKFAYIGSSRFSNGLPFKPNASAGFGVIDLATRKVASSRVFDGSITVRIMGYDAKTKRVAAAVDDVFRPFDCETKTFVPELPKDTPILGSFTAATPGDGMLYYGSDKSVIALDLKSGKATQIAAARGKVMNVAVAPDGTIYFSCGVDLYAIRSPNERQP